MSKRTFKGQIVSVKMNNTVIVAVDVPKRHKIYGKAIKTTKRLLAKTETGVALGDTVKIEESRPFSKNSSWKVIEKL
jgi:small subunit ribosomal protein S17